MSIWISILEFILGAAFMFFAMIFYYMGIKKPPIIGTLKVYNTEDEAPYIFLEVEDASMLNKNEAIIKIVQIDVEDSQKTQSL